MKAVFPTGETVYAAGEGGVLVGVQDNGDVNRYMPGVGSTITSIGFADPTIFLATDTGIYTTSSGAENASVKLPNSDTGCIAITALSGKVIAACQAGIVFGDPQSLTSVALSGATTLSVFSTGLTVFVGSDGGGIYQAVAPGFTWMTWISDNSMTFGSKNLAAGWATDQTRIHVAGDYDLFKTYDGTQWSSRFPELTSLSLGDLSKIILTSIWETRDGAMQSLYAVGRTEDAMGQPKEGLILQGQLRDGQSQTGWQAWKFPKESFHSVRGDSVNVYVAGASGTDGIVRCRPRVN